MVVHRVPNSCQEMLRFNSSAQARIKAQRTACEIAFFCDKCDVYFPNTPEGVATHEASYSHGHQSKLEAEGGSRDGTEEEKNTLCSSPLGSPMLRNKRPVFNNRTPHAGLRIMNARVYTKSRIY